MNAWFDRFAAATSRWLGRPIAFSLAVAAVVVWGATGPAFGYSEGWQLVINTGTTIVTFLMCFVLLNSSARDNAALHLKLDELIRVSAARNTLIAVETLPSAEIAAEAQNLRDAVRK